MTLKEIYHRLLPDSVRYPIGRARRATLDSWVRWRTPGAPLPPRHMLRSVQMTPWIWEYLDVGRATARTIRSALEDAGIKDSGSRASESNSESNRAPLVLDFGCGLGRTLRFLTGTGWHLEGCDVDRHSIEWAGRAFPEQSIRANEPEPPLPYPDHRFDGLYAVTVFTHFDRHQQSQSAAEIARVVKPSGLALITTMGPHALGGFVQVNTTKNQETLQRDGFFFDPKQADAAEFNARGAFHTRKGL